MNMWSTIRNPTYGHCVALAEQKLTGDQLLRTQHMVIELHIIRKKNLQQR
jgi:hypothetical protein